MGFVSRLSDTEILILLRLGDFFDCESVFGLALLETMARLRSQTPEPLSAFCSMCACWPARIALLVYSSSSPS